jgi:hypothetical protein
MPGSPNVSSLLDFWLTFYTHLLSASFALHASQTDQVRIDMVLVWAIRHSFMRIEVLTEVSMEVAFFWEVTPCSTRNKIYRAARLHTQEETVSVERLSFVIHEALLARALNYYSVRPSSCLTSQDIGLSLFIPLGQGEDASLWKCGLWWADCLSPGFQPAAHQVVLCGPRPHL